MRETASSLAAKVATSPDEAARWVETAAHNGSKPAIVNWGQMLLEGRGVGRDPEAALRWFRIAADTGYLDAINMVGRCHELGWGTPVDVTEAAHWYKRAAEQGHHWARFNLGCLLLNGENVERDVPAALSLFVRAARQGNAKAMNMLGRFREDGWVSPVKLGAAERWYRRAAVRGCFRGQFHLARFLFAQGHRAEALDWLQKSIAAAPPDFCRDVASLLSGHPDPAIGSLAEVARRGQEESWFEAPRSDGVTRKSAQGKATYLPRLRRIRRAIWRMTSQ